jgi:glycosyltransferase involved in cell wall biosynthesis
MHSMSNPLFTILTPTFNRAHILSRLAESLKNQGAVSFEWLVADDGSTDDTGAYLERLERAGELPLRWVRFENGGKHRAINRSIGMARGAWTFIVDSDDALPPRALERISSHIACAQADPSLGGIMGLRADFSGRIIGAPLPEGARSMSSTDVTFKAGIRGDKAELYRTDLLKRFPFPEFRDEKFITECVVWFRIAAAGYKLLLINETLYLCEYQPGGLSSNSLRLRAENPEGTLLFYREELALEYPARKLFREAVNFCRFALLSRGLWGYARAIAPLRGRTKRLVLAALPFGAAAAVFDFPMIKRRR